MADGHKGMDSESEEIRDILITISVIAKRLASKLENAGMEEPEDGKNEDAVGGA